MFHLYFVLISCEEEYSEEANDFGWLGIRYIISYLRENMDIHISVDRFTVENIEIGIEKVASCNPDLVGFPAFQQNTHFIKMFCDGIRKKCPDTITMIGNVEATTRPKEILQAIESLSIAVVGEGEYTLKELIECLINKQPLSQCKGIVYRNGSNIVSNEMRPLIEDLDILPFPDRTIMPTHKKNKIFDMITSRGCYGNCSFCSNKTFRMQKGSYVRYRSLDNILQEVKFLIKQYNASYISFCDDTFGDMKIHGKYMFEEFCNELIKQKINIRFRIQLRSENINEENISILSELTKNKGLDSIFIGFEAGNDEDLKLYGKRANLNTNYRSLNLLNQYNIPYNIGFIMFNPYSTIKNLQTNIQFLKKCNIMITPYLLCSRIRLFNSTAILEKVKQDGLLINDVIDPLEWKHEYNFKNSEIQIIWDKFQLMNDININFLDLDFMESFFRHLRIINHPFNRKSDIQKASAYFYSFTDTLAKDLFLYIESVVDSSSTIDCENTINRIKEKTIEPYSKILEMKKEITAQYMQGKRS